MYTQTRLFQAQLRAQSTPGVIHLVLPFPPTANVRWQWRASDGRVRKSKRISTYEVAVAEACVVQLVGVSRPLEPPYAMSLELIPPASYERPDLDNTLKNLIDALVCAGVLVDDRHMEAMSLVYGPAQDKGEVHVHVWTLLTEVPDGEPEASLSRGNHAV